MIFYSKLHYRRSNWVPTVAEKGKTTKIHLTRQFRRIQNEIDNDKSRLMFVLYAERQVVRPT